jgi:hypothetical protein
MSRLTNCQIQAQIEGLKMSLAGAVARGDSTRAKQVLRKLDGYCTELEERRGRGEDPGAEIQRDRRLEVAHGA